MDNKGIISLYREICFLTVHMTINTMNPESIKKARVCFNLLLKQLWLSFQHLHASIVLWLQLYFVFVLLL